MRLTGSFMQKQSMQSLETCSSMQSQDTSQLISCDVSVTETEMIETLKTNS
jgi:hypothetical protein